MTAGHRSPQRPVTAGSKSSWGAAQAAAAMQELGIPRDARGEVLSCPSPASQGPLTHRPDSRVSERAFCRGRDGFSQSSRRARAARSIDGAGGHGAVTPGASNREKKTAELLFTSSSASPCAHICPPHHHGSAPSSPGLLGEAERVMLGCTIIVRSQARVRATQHVHFKLP